LQGLPLALQQAIAYIKNKRNIDKGFGIENYIGIFKVKNREVLDFNFRIYNNDPYLKTLYTTWKITLDIINREEEAGKTAIEILNIMSFLFPEISIQTFSTVYESDLLSEAMHLLRIYSMVSPGSTPSECIVHRLVQKVVNIYLENDAVQFRKIALSAEELVMYYANNMENRLHYVNFLLNIVNHPELGEDLKLKNSFKRISSMLMIDNAALITYFFDVAYIKLNKEKYIEFITESFLNYRKQAIPFYVLNLLEYIEKKLAEGMLTKSDVEKIIHNKNFLLKPEYRVKHISPIPEKRERQLYIVLLISSFRKKIFPDPSFSSCSSERKKRNSGISCLQKKQALKEEKQQKTIKHLEKV
ncbi:MAG: hypothetical protein O7C59_11250, partial [Rickettsia endosymbiont of Ixodes persulcatus]|nr:hypothetical protein [Rickettsia endosymbiont of Ixodes persulcatus]